MYATMPTPFFFVDSMVLYLQRARPEGKGDDNTGDEEG